MAVWGLLGGGSGMIRRMRARGRVSMAGAAAFAGLFFGGRVVQNAVMTGNPERGVVDPNPCLVVGGFLIFSSIEKFKQK